MMKGGYINEISTDLSQKGKLKSYIQIKTFDFSLK
jgi:hypothetical protein